MKLKESKEFKRMVEICKEDNLLYLETKFTCYHDGIFNFELHKDGFSYYFDFITEDDILHDSTVEWLLGLNSYYFSFSKEYAKNVIENLYFSEANKMEVYNKIQKN